MSIASILVGQLSDGRLQLFASTSDGTSASLWSCWKSSASPDASWTDWSPFDPDGFVGFGLGAAARQPDPATGHPGALQLFTAASQPLEVDVVGGPDIATTWKISSTDSRVRWAPWEIFAAAQKGPPGSPATGLGPVAAALLSDGRIQVFVTELNLQDGSSQLLSNWQQAPADGWVGFRPFVPQPPEILRVLTAGSLSDGRVQVWGVGDSGIWSTWKVDGAHSGWFDWSRFQSWGSTLTFNLPVALSVGSLIDGRLQLWASVQETDNGLWRFFYVGNLSLMSFSSRSAR